jgi:hypothetical protein
MWKSFVLFMSKGVFDIPISSPIKIKGELISSCIVYDVQDKVWIESRGDAWGC